MRRIDFLDKRFLITISFIVFFLYTLNVIFITITIKDNYSEQIISVLGDIAESGGKLEKQAIDNLMIGNTESYQKGKLVLKKYGYNFSGENLIGNSINRDIIYISIPLFIILIIVLVCFRIMYQNHIGFLKRLDKYLDDFENSDFQNDFIFDYDTNQYTKDIVRKLHKLSLKSIHNISLIKSEKEKMRDFMEDLSHQMKTPLTIAHLYIERYMLENPTIQTNKLELGLKQLEKMTVLINSYLKVGMLNSTNTKLEITNCNINEFMEAIIDEVQPLLDGNNMDILIQGDPDTYFEFDAFWMREVMLNLLKNSIEHSPKSSDIKLTYHKNQHNLLIQVTDEGSGIEENNLVVLFDRFISSVRQADGSNGLGLSIAKQAVNRHFGQIKVKNNAEKGVTFEILLPILKGKEVYNIY